MTVPAHTGISRIADQLDIVALAWLREHSSHIHGDENSSCIARASFFVP